MSRPIRSAYSALVVTNLAARAVHWEASDLRHVLIAGEDGLADMLIGRLSAQDSESAMALVEKVIAYGADPPLGPWRSRVGFIADDDRIGSVSFDEMCEEIRAQTMSASLPTETVYLRELPLVDNLLLPAEVIDRPKRGFNAPVSHWIAGPLQEFARAVTTDPIVVEWFEPERVEQLWCEHLSRRRDNGLKLFGLTCFGLWLRDVLSGTPEDTALIR